LLVVGELLKDSQFLEIECDLPEVAKYTSLWATKEAKRIHDTKILWVLMEARICMWINRRPCLSPTVYNSLQSFAYFKVNMHNVYIRVWKDPAQQ